MYESKIILFKFWKYLSSKRRNQVFITIFVSIAGGIFEIITINAALPFLSVLTAADNLSIYPITYFISQILNLPVDENIINPIIIFFCCSITISTFFKLLNIWLIHITGASIAIDLNVLALSHTIYQPYSFHINNSSSKVVTANTLYIDRTNTGIINSLLLISNFIVSIFIVASIFFINPYLALSSLIIISNIYFLIAKKLNKRVKINGKKMNIAGRAKVKYLQEVIGSIRSVLLESNQEIYIKEIRRVDSIFRFNEAQTNFIAEFPRFVIECLILLIIAFVCLLVLKNGNEYESKSFIVLLGTFTLAFQRLLPVVQRFYTGWINIRFVSSDTENIYKIIERKIRNNSITKITPLKFKESIKLESVDFLYEDSKNIISNLNLEILKGQRIGIIGKTGSGKSTLVDLLIGLLEPSNGKVYVDGKDINNRKYPLIKNKWMSSISHVPQEIFLTEGTIAENIAFGLKDNKFSMPRIVEAAKKAQIHEFINSKPNGYSTYIGERGIKLSGGQKQRIGIARALYKNAKILILDEATSAIDNETEIDLMKSINTLNRDMTIISIAHRHSTLKDFDRILVIENGHITADGTASEIL